jgi:hypothetical protein
MKRLYTVKYKLRVDYGVKQMNLQGVYTLTVTSAGKLSDEELREIAEGELTEKCSDFAYEMGLPDSLDVEVTQVTEQMCPRCDGHGLHLGTPTCAEDSKPFSGLKGVYYCALCGVLTDPSNELKGEDVLRQALLGKIKLQAYLEDA